VGSLLEVGTGFHPELTGRENIFLNGSLLGMRSKEIRRRFDEIVDFSGVQRFLDTPVKRYSSGMYVRLAFSIAAHLESEILAIDEVLAVGDAEFREQSLAKMREVAKTGRTVLYVSHQVQTVRSLCTSAILLERGLLRQHGGVDDCLEAYRKSFAALQAHNTEPDNRPGSGFARFLMARMSKEVYEPADEKVIDFGIEAGDRLVGKFYVSCHINDDSGATVLQCDSRLVGFWVEPGTETSGRLTISTPWLKPGKYSVDLYAIQEGALDVWEHACHFEVLPVLPYPQTTTDDAVAFSPILSDFEYREW
jgi:lipopolysaccharide transport system ATP-binding protein